MFLVLFGYKDIAKEGILLYAAAYSLAIIGIFAILIKMKDYTFDGYNGLAKNQPLLAANNVSKRRCFVPGTACISYV